MRGGREAVRELVGAVEQLAHHDDLEALDLRDDALRALFALQSLHPSGTAARGARGGLTRRRGRPGSLVQLYVDCLGAYVEKQIAREAAYEGTRRPAARHRR